MKAALAAIRAIPLWVVAFIVIVLVGSAFRLDDDGAEATAEIKLDALAAAHAEARHDRLPTDLKRVLAAKEQP